MKTTTTTTTASLVGCVEGYPTRLLRKVYETDQSVTYLATNAEFGEGLLTIFDFGATFMDGNLNLHRFTI